MLRARGCVADDAFDEVMPNARGTTRVTSGATSDADVVIAIGASTTSQGARGAVAVSEPQLDDSWNEALGPQTASSRPAVTETSNARTPHPYAAFATGGLDTPARGSYLNVADEKELGYPGD